MTSATFLGVALGSPSFAPPALGVNALPPSPLQLLSRRLWPFLVNRQSWLLCEGAERRGEGASHACPPGPEPISALPSLSDSNVHVNSGLALS